MRETRSLAGKACIVTGGGSGIGRAIALALAAEGARVLVAGRTEEKLRRTAHEASPPLLYYTCDVGQVAMVGRLFEFAERELGGVDILVNAAGVNTLRRRIAESLPEEFEATVRTNLLGTFHCMAAALPIMRRQRSGLIVNIVSVAGKRVLEVAGAAYCAAKFGQAALGLYCYLEVRNDGVRVTNIYPGETDTPILDVRPEPPSPELRRRMLRPEAIADCVVFLAKLPPEAVVPELVILPSYQPWS